MKSIHVVMVKLGKQIALFLVSFLLPTLSHATCKFIGAAMDKWSDAANWDCGHAPFPADDVIIEAGDVVLVDVDVMIADLMMTGGTLVGPGKTITITADFEWQGGTLETNTIIPPPSKLAMNMGGAKILKSELTIEAGSSGVFEAGSFTIDAGKLIIKGEFGVDFNTTIAEGVTPGSIDIKAGGKFIKADGPGGFLEIDVVVENLGIIEAAKGSIDFNNMVMSSGDIASLVGTSIRFFDDSIFGMGSDFAGGGSFEFKGGAITLDFGYDGAVNLVFEGASSILFGKTFKTSGLISHKSGDLGGAGGKLIAAGTYNWEDGDIGASFELNIDGAGTLNIMGISSKRIPGKLKVDGLAKWFTTSLAVPAGGTLEVTGIFETDFDGTLSGVAFGSVGSIINSGTIEKKGGGGITEINVPISNSGTIKVSSDTIDIGEKLTNTGTVNISAGNQLRLLDGSDFGAASIFLGTGDIDFVLGSHIISSSSAIPNLLAFFGSTTTVSGAFMASNEVYLLGGTLKGSGSISCSDAFFYSGGDLELNITILASTKMEIYSTDAKTLKSTITQNGTLKLLENAVFSMASPGIINNTSTFTFETGTDILSSGTIGTINNTGTLLFLGSASTSTLAVNLNNMGNLTGVGTVVPSTFTNTGNTTPGLSPGVMTIDSDFTNGKTIFIEIVDNTSPGMGYDQLVINGDINLEDTLTLSQGPSVPLATYTVIRCTTSPTCLSGTFEKVNLPGGYSIAYTGNSVEITRNFFLPVELTSFGATWTNKGSLLRWTTKSETNNSHFEIERSLDAINFQMIGTLEGNGTTLNPNNYQFLDSYSGEYLSQKNWLYYRLKQVDFDGTTNYSSIISISPSFGHSELTLVTLQNPTQNSLPIQVNIKDPSKIDLSIVDIYGRVLLTGSRDAIKGENYFSLELDQLLPGSYYLIAQTLKSRAVSKFFKN